MNTLVRTTAQWTENIAVRLYEPLLGRLLADTRAQLLDMCHSLGVRRVLDVCCGPAGCSQVLHQGGLQVCGLDYSWLMLRQAQRTMAGAAFFHGLLRADAGCLPFASWRTHSPTDTAFFDAAVLVLALHTMPLAQAQAVVREVLRVTPLCIVVDYRLAERNIDLPAAAFAHSVEWLVGGEHYAHYKKFMAAGAVEGFARLSGFRIGARRRVLGGAGGIIALMA